MSCIKAFPFTIKTIEWKNQLDVKEDLQCYFFVQVYKYKPLYILYLDICIHKLFHVRFVTSHRKNAKHYDKGGEKIYNDDYQSKDFFLKA